MIRAGLLAAAVVTATGTAEAADATHVSLQQAVGLALHRNPTFLVAREEIVRAQGLLEQARAQSTPILGVTGQFLQLNSNRVFQNAANQNTVTDPETQFNVTGTLTVPVVAP